MSRRTPDEVPPAASDDAVENEVVDLTDAAIARRSRPNRPLVAERIRSTETMEEILSEVEERASAAYSARRKRLISPR